ncbi:MAG: nucleoside triphosphate pyrophosphohydrolase [Bacteroidota bacterium]|nr:nucleoside triphosphate pyrophosphohydrolase [Bacteroidota bacterium]
MNSIEQKLEAFKRILIIMDELREQCPWDKEQTFESLRTNTIEETYELCDAIMAGDMKEMKKELGDLLLHIVFYSRIASETKEFDIADVIHSLCEKLINRHPHIYGNVQADDAEQVKQNWEQIKLKEGNKSVLGGVPNSLPSLVKAYRMQEKAASVGFDWDTKEQVWAKVDEELIELKHELDNDSAMEKKEDEFGDLLFALINYGRHAGINADNALERTNQKFKTRFHYIEDRAKAENINLNDAGLELMDSWWNEAKGRI